MSDSRIADEAFWRITTARTEGYVNGHIDGIKEGRVLESIENLKEVDADRGSVFVLGAIFGCGIGMIVVSVLDWLLG